jgi:phage shock protein PspC (stress-responsive transcriptional regulator)
MFCQKCGMALPPGANFCSSCGTPLNANVFTASPFNTMYRPRGLRMLAGVCAALYLRYGWDLTAVRIVTVILGVFLFPLAEIAYLVAWILIPEEIATIPQQPNVAGPNAPPQNQGQHPL